MVHGRRKHGRQDWGVTATDGFRFARFTTSDTARFDAHACRAPLPHWIVDWCKASDTATVNVRNQGDRAVFTFSDYGTFRPSALPFFAWTHLVGELRRLNNPSFCYSRPGSEMGSLVKFLEEGRRDHSKGAPVFILPGNETAWTVAFGEKPHSVSLNPAYLIDALKSLARAAREAGNATVDAQWSGGLDPVAFTAPHLLTLVMPRRK